MPKRSATNNDSSMRLNRLVVEDTETDITSEIVQIFDNNCENGYMSIFADTCNWDAMVTPYEGEG